MNRWCLAILCLLVSGIALAGCDEIEPNVGGQPQQRPRPAAEPIRTGRPAPIRSSPPTDAPLAAASYQQLMLTGEPAPAQASSGLRYVRLQHATPRNAGEALGTLYLPSGPSVSPTRYTLIYALPLEAERAAPHVADLDVSTTSNDTPSTECVNFSCAVVSLYAAQQPELASGSLSLLRTALNAFERVARKSDAPKWHQWAAGMMAAAIAADRLYDYARAAELYSRAEQAATPGSLEHLTSVYHHGRTLLLAGKAGPGRRALETAIGQFGALRGSEPFERARRLLSELDRRK